MKLGTIIDGIQPVLQPIMENLNEALGIENPYFSTAQVDELLEQMKGDTSVEVLTQAFLEYFIDAREEDFDKTLFHFLLKRLGKSKSDIAVAYCLDLLKIHPVETADILKYFQSIDVINQIEDSVVEFLRSEHAVYPYQNYQILEWFSEYTQKPSRSIC